MSINGYPTRDFEGVYVDPLPPPRVIQAGRQTFVGYTKSYTDQLEEDLEQAQASVRALEAEVLKLREQLASRREGLSEALASTDLGRALKTVESQRQRIARLTEVLKAQAKQRQHAALTQRSPIQVTAGKLTLNISRLHVGLDGRFFKATQNEMAMLLHLAQRLDRVYDTASLGAAIGARDGSVRTFMWRLRPKMESIGAEGYLHSRGRGGAWGGYWMTDPERDGGAS